MYKIKKITKKFEKKNNIKKTSTVMYIQHCDTDETSFLRKKKKLEIHYNIYNCTKICICAND